LEEIGFLLKVGRRYLGWVLADKARGNSQFGRYFLNFKYTSTLELVLMYYPLFDNYLAKNNPIQFYQKTPNKPGNDRLI